MLRSVDDLRGFAITATDGAIGEVEDFYFDDELWAVRYLVVNTGTWRESQQVLISPISVEKVDRATNQMFVALTMNQVKNSPDINTHQPVSRQHETAFAAYYGYPSYWGGPFLWGAAAYPAGLGAPTAGETAAAAAAARAREASGDVHLRSTKEVTGYHLQATDGEIGHVEDFIVEDETWAVRYLVADTSNWLPAKKVLLTPRWVGRVSWNESKVFVDLTKGAIEQSPEYDESALISREYETSLHGHYGRPGYWS
jgi:hypothetical protein